jgi:dTDP-4-dehydrorhamnose 3,5-epimerase
MKFIPTRIDGAFIIEAEPFHDDRGTFSRTFDATEFAEHGLAGAVAQASIATTARQGTIRGMHWQVAPALETKYVRCTRGAIFDQIVDLRPDSPTYLESVGVELSADNARGLFVPVLCAHGYQTLTDDTEVHYVMSEFYDPATQRGHPYDDPAFGLEWPLQVTVVSDKDLSWPPFEGGPQRA